MLTLEDIFFSPGSIKMDLLKYADKNLWNKISARQRLIRKKMDEYKTVPKQNIFFLTNFST